MERGTGMDAKKAPDDTLWIDPDDAPELTEDIFGDADEFVGDRFIRRGRGRPESGRTKEQNDLRLDPEVLVALRAGGPGWQARINAVPRRALGLEDARGAAGGHKT